MTAHEEEKAFTVDATLRNFAPINPFVIRWDWPLFRRDAALDPQNLKQSRQANTGMYVQKYKPEDVLNELSIVHGNRPKDLLKRLSELKGMSRAQFYRLALKLRTDGQLIERE